jgi:hypothetical protein
MTTTRLTSAVSHLSLESRTPLTFIWPVITFASVLVALLAVAFSHSYIGHQALEIEDTGRVFACETLMLKSLRPQPDRVDLTILESIHTVCYRSVADSDVLTDFGIRKSAYLNQQLQTAVLMWMVVAITLSGVVLAGVQLVAGYKLAVLGKAAFEQGGKLSIEQSRISIGSSVTGLLVLAISLAFFTVFVYKVYFIKDPGDAPASGAALPAVAYPTQAYPTATSPQIHSDDAIHPYGTVAGGKQERRN